MQLAALALAGIACMPAYAERYTVNIEGFGFKPAALEVKAGDEIVWVNKDIVDHTATAGDGAFDSKSVKPGSSWRWKAARAGRHDYICALHPTMTGTVTVK